MKKRLNLLQSPDSDYFLDCVDELYRTIESDASFFVSKTVVKRIAFKYYIIRLLINFPMLSKLRICLNFTDTVNFASMISGDFKLLIPYALLSRNNYIYMYDAWPRFFKWIFPLLGFFNIKYVFFSSKQAYQAHQSNFSGSRCKSAWIPEALNASEYHFRPFSEKKIDVLEFGRCYEKYHNLIVNRLAHEGKVHIYKRPGTAVLYPNKASFCDALAHTKIVICIPSNITNPERAEDISTMTLRYLQAMASKCLVVGIIPQDMGELFSYDPIVEIDMSNASDQIISILNNFIDYIPLIERNYSEVLRNHQWLNRWEVIKKKIEQSS